MRVINRIIRWILIAVVVITIGVSIAIYIYKDRLIQEAITQLNEKMPIPVQVGKVDIAWFHGWPDISIGFYDVTIESLWDEPLLKADEVFVLFDPWVLLDQKVSIEEVEIHNATVHIRLDEKNNSNIKIIKQGDSTGESSLKLKSISFKNVDVIYVDRHAHVDQHYAVDKLNGTLILEKGQINIKIKSHLVIKKFATKKWSLKKERDINLNIQASFDQGNHDIHVAASNIEIDHEPFSIKGKVTHGLNSNIDFDISADNLNYSFLVGFLPENMVEKVSTYQGSGKISLAVHLSGPITTKQLPALTANFSVTDMSLRHPAYEVGTTGLSLAGNLSISDLNNLSDSRMSIPQFNGLVFKKPLTGSFQLRNFSHPEVKLEVAGDVPVGWLLSTVNVPISGKPAGEIAINLDWSMRPVSDGQQKENILNGNMIISDGAAEINSLLPLSDINGKILFDNQSVEFQNVRGNFGNSRAVVNGQVQRLLIDSASSLLKVATNINADFIDGSELSAFIRHRQKPSANANGLNVSKIDLTINLYAEKLTFLRFFGEDLSAEISWVDNTVEIADFSTLTIGGSVQGHCVLTQIPSGDIFINTKARARNTYLDSLLYVFGNFRQNFITNRDLKGRLFSEIDASMYFDNLWHLDRSSLIANAKLGIKDGELIDFEPIMALSKYIDDKQDHLSRLKFADLINYIHVANDTVFIPEMSIRTNVRSIRVGGIHTLDQQIDYKLTVPIINEKVDKDAVFGAIEQPKQGAPNLLFRIKGTAFDYKVNYDIGRAGKKLLERLNLSKTSRKSGKNNRDSTLLEEDFFNWEN